MKNEIWPMTAPAGLDGSEDAWPLLGAKVMMVDDEPLMTDLIQTHLENAGYSNFVVTNDPREALDMLRREDPGVLLLDLMMPQVSGFELLTAIRTDRALRFTPVIVLTAATGADSKLRALKLGATDFLSKPVDASELVLRVRNTLAFHQYHNRLLNFDPVTGLPNQRMFDRGVDELATRKEQIDGLVALFSVSVPECSTLHGAIDQVSADGLANVLARRFEQFGSRAYAGAALAPPAERSPRVARLGVDQFALLIEGFADADAVEAAANDLLAAVAEPVALGVHQVAPKAWIGIAVAPADGRSAEALRKSAELAAAHAKAQGTAQVEFASQELRAKSTRRLTLGLQLRGAVQRGELLVHYQPKVVVGTNRIVGAEALVRWQHPDHGLVAPGQFIPLAEELGLIDQVGQWVMQQACRDAAAWTQAGLGALSIAVNVAKPQFMAGNLGSVMRQALFDSGLPGRQVVIELTESMLMDNVQAALAMLHELKALGVSLSIDDFGTGYSSLSYLKRFPIDELKIDRSFIVDLPGRQVDVAIVRAVVELGHSLGLSVTAEGVETPAQLGCIQQLACDNYQGFLFSRPVPADQFAALLSPGLPPAAQ